MNMFLWLFELFNYMEVNTIIKQHDTQATISILTSDIGGTDDTEGAVSNFQPLYNLTDNKTS